MRWVIIWEWVTLPLYHHLIRIGTVDQMEILWEATKGKNGHPAMQWILEGFTQKPKQNMVLIGVYQVMQAFVLLKLTNIKKHANTGCIGFQMSQKLAASILAFQAFKGFIGT